MAEKKQDEKGIYWLRYRNYGSEDYSFCVFTNQTESDMKLLVKAYRLKYDIVVVARVCELL